MFDPFPLDRNDVLATRDSSQLLAVAFSYLHKALLGTGEPACQARPAGGEHGLELRQAGRLPGGGAHGFLPEWMAMIPPAVSTQRTSSSPAEAS